MTIKDNNYSHMKYILTLFFSLITLLSISQKKINQPNVLGFKKAVSKVDTNYYSLSGNVFISDGHSKKVKVYFEGHIPIKNWKETLNTSTLKGWAKTDISLFESVTTLISVDAQWKLKNKESFVPLPKQFFMWDDESKKFMSNYKMMGRNAYGNLTESTALSYFNPSDLD